MFQKVPQCVANPCPTGAHQTQPECAPRLPYMGRIIQFSHQRAERRVTCVPNGMTSCDSVGLHVGQPVMNIEVQLTVPLAIGNCPLFGAKTNVG